VYSAVLTMVPVVQLALLAALSQAQPSDNVAFGYRGMNRLASRTQDGTTVKFEYDAEDALVAIHN
jgi:hypothetical protein